MAEALLVLNAGSSSLKFSVFLDGDPPRPLMRGAIEELGTRPRFVASAAGAVIHEQTWPEGTTLGHADAIDVLLSWGRSTLPSEHRVAAVGHRVVHGGLRFSKPTVVDANTLTDLEALVPLAPLHQPHNLSAIRAVFELAPGMLQVACFDTAFHATQPAVARAFALPPRYAEEGVCRYGFHGLSYEYVAAALEGVEPRAAAGRTVIAHLGNGASLCALRAGRSVATTMSFTALDGLMMGTRCGSLDPGVVLYLIQQKGMTPAAVTRLLYEESGLFGVSGGSSDMRELLARTDAAAASAVDLFVYRVARELGSLVAALGGLDALVFTGGIGEHSTPVRARICRDANWLGLDFDEAANDLAGPRLSLSGSRVSAWVIPANEEAMIALHTRRALRGRR